MSHNACCVIFAGRKIRLPRFNIGQCVLYRSRTWIVNGIYCPLGGSVIYQLESSDGTLPCELYEHELLSVGEKQPVEYCGFRVGDTVLDRAMLIKVVSKVVGFDYKRQMIKIRPVQFGVTYFACPADLVFVDPETLETSKERINHEKENNN